MNKSNSETKILRLEKELHILKTEFEEFKATITSQISNLLDKSIIKKTNDKFFTFSIKDELLETFNSIEDLFYSLKRPVKLIEISEFMNMSKETTYNRCEKLIEVEKIKKFYGRDLLLKPSKSVFYRPNVTLYDISVLQSLENANEKKIANIFVQHYEEDEGNDNKQGIKISFIRHNSKLSEIELQKGLQKLLNNGYIDMRKYPATKEIYYKIVS